MSKRVNSKTDDGQATTSVKDDDNRVDGRGTSTRKRPTTNETCDQTTINLLVYSSNKCKQYFLDIVFSPSTLETGTTLTYWVEEVSETSDLDTNPRTNNDLYTTDLLLKNYMTIPDLTQGEF